MEESLDRPEVRHTLNGQDAGKLPFLAVAV